MIVLVLTAFAGSAAKASEADEARIQKLSPAAQALVAAGAMQLLGPNQAQAAAEFSKAIQLEPKCALLYRYRGEAYEGARNFPQALADYDTAIRLDPSYMEAYAARGGLRFSQDQFEFAIPDLLKSTDFSSDKKYGFNTTTNLKLLDCYLQEKQYAKVVELSTLALKQIPWASYYRCRASAYLGLGENRKCVEDCDVGIKLDAGMVQLNEIRAEGMKRLASTHH